MENPQNLPNLEKSIKQRANAIFQSISEEKPSLFNKDHWMGKVLDWSMQNESFKVQLFRFVDVFPSLTTGKNLTKHIQEYFSNDSGDVPSILKWGAKGLSFGGAFTGKILNTFISHNIKTMAKQFIIGESADSAINNVLKLRQDGFACIFDLLGEATITESESQEHETHYIELLDALGKDQSKWTPLSFKSSSPTQDWGYSPKVHISVKASALYSQIKPEDFECSIEKVLLRLEKIYQKVIDINGAMCIDMESYKYKALTIEIFKRLRSNPNFRHYKHLGIVLQAYLKETEADTQDLIAWAKQENLPIQIRLVKGAYWDFESIHAKQCNWEPCVWMQKHETDAAFERTARHILENSDICYFACGSHNIRSISMVMETAAALGVSHDRYEFQVLYGMAEPVRKALQSHAGRVRLYCPYGDMIPGMAYLVRRLLENTANESFLRQSFVEGEALDKLIANPADVPSSVEPEDSDYFKNEPEVDFTIPGEPQRFKDAIHDVRRKIGQRYPLHIGGKDIFTHETSKSLNPNNPDEIVGEVALADLEHANQAIEVAHKSFTSWSKTPVKKRAALLRKAADITRRRKYELCAWQVLEVGKQWNQAYGDVNEGIDFLNYYADEMERLDKPQRLGVLPGEVNMQTYVPRGVATVIAPWNFPFAISIGMISAALVSGNTVVYKPAELSCVQGALIKEILAEAGFPSGVFNFLPGKGRIIGDILVDHKLVSLIAFTGSMDVGLRLIERAAITHPEQKHVKKVICEMGGKNGIIVDDDVDLDEAIPAILYSAFAFQGQKCSACSRLIVLEDIYDRLVERLVEAAKALSVGSPEDPKNLMGAVIDSKAQEKVMSYQDLARTEGRVLFCSDHPGKGYSVPMMIVDGITPEKRLAQEEIFGPVLAVMKAKDMDQAIDWLNSTQFGLTGGMMSRSPVNIERARTELDVANLYINRSITGATVARQAFGGAHMSGVGTKAGGPDYLLHFTTPKVVTENTMRRGFAPAEE